MRTSIIAIFLACLLSNSAQAAIIDDGNYFMDTITGYTWMDLTTYDLNMYSYNNIEAAISGTEFQIATISLLEDLWSSTYIETFDYLYDVMGGIPGFNQIGGIFDNERGDDTVGLAWATPSSLAIGDWRLESDNKPYDGGNYNIVKTRPYIFGFWLVNTSSDSTEPNVSPVPEPNTLLLFGTGLIGLAALRRTRRP